LSTTAQLFWDVLQKLGDASFAGVDVRAVHAMRSGGL
jgi:hypothetical protein